MRVGHLDASSGASGDMFLGALVAVGASVEAIQGAVDRLGVGDVRLAIGRVRRSGLAAISVRVRAPQELPPVRTWQSVRDLLRRAELPDQVRRRSLSTFQRLADAEATVHGVPVEDVHFHEIGALDTLADVVGTATAIHTLGIDRLTCGPIATGTGLTETMHGVIPIPGPAVTALLPGFTLVGRDVPAELLTPTGAALIAEFSEPVPAMPTMVLEASGYGAGSRDLDHPNVLRLTVGRPTTAETDAEIHSRVVLEATIDDLSPELLPLVLDRLRDAGADDAWATPVLMKKGRPGYTVTALAAEGEVPALRRVLYRESSTIGVRWWPVTREALAREWVKVTVEGHHIQVKIARHGGEVVTVAPEADDVRAVADATGLPARDIHGRAEAAARLLVDRG